MSRLRTDPLLTAARLLLYGLGGLFLFAFVMLIIGVGAMLTVERATLYAEIAKIGAPASLFWLLLLAVLLIVVMFAALLKFVQLLLRMIATVDAGDPFIPENGLRLEQLGWLTVAIQTIILALNGISWVVERYKPGAGFSGDYSLSGWLLVLVLFILARVFRHGTNLRAEVEGDGLMAITVKLDDLLHDRRMTLTELAERIDITLANLSILKTGKAKAIRFSTLSAICTELDCQPGDLLGFTPGADPDD